MPIFTDIEGVYANGVAAGIKKNGNKDLAFIYIPEAYGVAGVFTRNQFCASSVTHSKKSLKKGLLKAFIINSGNANAGTGERGVQDTKVMARIAAQKLGLKPGEVGVASTGKIGEYMPMDKVTAGMEMLFRNPYSSQGDAAAEAILTTDLCVKTVHCEADVNGRTIIVSGFTKGSGMIAPNMATTLTFLVTNVAMPSDVLQKRFSKAIDKSYNMISVDTDTSTNDLAVIFSKGKKSDQLRDTLSWEVFDALLLEACITLAKAIARDGEGATKLIEANVTRAVSVKDARCVAMNIINSPLVKTAMYGADPNWGRIVAAACRDPDVKLNPEKLTLTIGDTLVFEKGEAVDFDRAALSDYLKEDEVVLTLSLGLGIISVTAWGCDLTEKYVEINTEYS